MSDTQTERPSFFEGQYLGADDLQALADHARRARARHALGAHTWGIAVGLDLTEREAPDGSIEVHIQPGMAWDGYGRPILLLSPHRLAESRFALVPTGNVPVWIRYHEEGTRGMRPGFEVCDATDEYRRVRETFDIEVGSREAIEDRQQGLNIAGETLADARRALRLHREDAPLLCDASVPHQVFPGAEARWLVPLGVVRWVQGAPGHFELPEDKDALAALLTERRRRRRYMGLVAESIHAANGLIRLCPRTTEPAEGQTTDAACAAGALSDTDLVTRDGRVRPRELVIVEGDLGARGHVRLHGSRLELHNLPPGDTDVPLLLRRERNRLELAIGDASVEPSGAERLAIGPVGLTDPGDYGDLEAGLSMDDGGRIGIGTRSPGQFPGAANALVIADDASTGLTIASGALGTGSLRFVTGETATEQDGGFLRFDQANQRLELGSRGETHLSITRTGQLRMDSDATDGALHIKGANPDLILDLDEASSFTAAEVEFRLEGAVKSRIYWSRTDDKTYLENRGHRALTIDGEQVGIATRSPRAPLEVRGAIRLGPTGDLFALGAEAQGLRVVTGRISGAGQWLAGSGFQPSHPGGTTGTYQVDFDEPFSLAPVVLVSASDPNGRQDNIANAYRIGTSGFSVWITDGGRAGNTPENSEFNFIALGPA